MKSDPEPRGVADSSARASGRSSLAVRLLLTVAVGAVLYVARSAVIPVVLAVLFALIQSAPVEALHRRGVPRSAAAITILLVLVGVFGAALDMLWTPAQHWWNSAPQTLRVIERKVQPIARVVGRLEMLSDRAGEIATAPKTSPAAGSPQAAPEAQAPSPETHVAVAVINQTRTALVSILTTTILALFLLAGGPPMLARLTASLSTDLQSQHALTVINAVRNEVGRYYASLALINVGLGMATATVTMLLGMPNPLLWGATAGILNFIPYVGSALTLLLLVVVAFVSFDNVGRVAAVGLSYLVLATLEGQVVQPLVLGRRLELNPMMVFLALWFGGWFWGIAGIVIAVPSLVTLKVIAEHSRHGGVLTQILSPNEEGRLKTLTARASKSLAKKPTKQSA